MKKMEIAFIAIIFAAVLTITGTSFANRTVIKTATQTRISKIATKT